MSETPEPEAVVPQDVLKAAIERFNDVNKGAPAGMPQVQLSPQVEMEAGLNALILLLIEKGLVDEAEFIGRKQLEYAKLIDRATEVAKEQKRAVLGRMLAARPGEMPFRNGN